MYKTGLLVISEALFSFVYADNQLMRIKKLVRAALE
jgi:hypothetical protein